MIFPFNVDVPMERWPWANWVLIGITCILSLVLWIDPDANAQYFILFRGDDFNAVQLIGGLFGHGDIIHLAGNMFGLFVFGNAINAKLGHLWFILLYFGLGLAESLIWLATGDGEATLGASGAIMGIMGVFLVLYPRNDVTVFYWFGFYFVGTFLIPSFAVILLYVAFDVLGLVLSGDSAVNYIAHIAGFSCGFAIAMGLCISGLVQAGRGEETLIDVFHADRARNRKESKPRFAKSEYGKPVKIAPELDYTKPSANRAPLPPVPRDSPRDLPPIPLDGDEPPPPPIPIQPKPKPPRPPVPMPPSNPTQSSPANAPPSKPRPRPPQPPPQS